MKDFLPLLPGRLDSNYVLVSDSASLKHSTLSHPRILMFGPDARLLVGIASDPASPEYEAVELGEFVPEDGSWRFRDLDFSSSQPTLDADDSRCRACRGTPARPTWGSYLDWPGVVGAPDDKLTADEAATLSSLRDTKVGSDRFDQLEFLADYEPGATFSIPARSYAYANTDFDFEVGKTAALGLGKRVLASSAYASLNTACCFSISTIT